MRPLESSHRVVVSVQGRIGILHVGQCFLPCHAGTGPGNLACEYLVQILSEGMKR